MSRHPSFYKSAKPEARYEAIGVPLSDIRDDGHPQQYYESQAYQGAGGPGGVWEQPPPPPPPPMTAPEGRNYRGPHASGHPLVTWHVSWRSPSVMLGLFLSATAMAVGHHLYYASLDGVPVQTVSSQWNLEGLRHSQEWKIRFGSAFGFVVKAMFAGAVATAYQEYTWVLVRKKAISVEGLDALFAAGHNFLSFFSREYLAKAKFGALIALLIWLIPLSALVTPATLTVVPSSIDIAEDLSVPNVDFTIVDPLYNYNNSDLMTDMHTTDNGVTPYLSRLVSSTSTTTGILPMAPLLNSTYNLTFHGPSFQCEKPSEYVEEAIYLALNATVVEATSYAMGNRSDTHGIAWMAMAPAYTVLTYMSEQKNLSRSQSVWLNFVVSCIIGPTSGQNLNNIDSQCEGITIPQPMLKQDKINSTFVRSLDTSLNYGRLWVWAQDEIYDCVLSDTKYEAAFEYSASENVQRINPSYNFTWTDEDLYGSYFPVGNAMVNLLQGAVRGFRTGISTYKTRITETAIFGALNSNPDGEEASNAGISSVVLTPKTKALARNKTVGELIEELSRNVTLGLFSADQVWSASGTTTNVITSIPVNVYSYNFVVLVTTYAVAFAAALVGVLVGISSYLSNGVSHNTTFSAFMAATRNRTLDKISEGHSLGSDPLGWQLGQTKLKFGLLMNEGKAVGPDGEVLRRAGFGLEDEVVPLARGAPCY